MGFRGFLLAGLHRAGVGAKPSALQIVRSEGYRLAGVKDGGGPRYLYSRPYSLFPFPIRFTVTGLDLSTHPPTFQRRDSRERWKEYPSLLDVDLERNRS